MPRYFMNIREADRLIADPDGRDYNNLEEAQAEATKGARSILAEQLAAGEPLIMSQVEICDVSGSVVATVDFRDTFETS